MPQTITENLAIAAETTARLLGEIRRQRHLRQQQHECRQTLAPNPAQMLNDGRHGSGGSGR